MTAGLLAAFFYLILFATTNLYIHIERFLSMAGAFYGFALGSLIG